MMNYETNSVHDSPVGELRFYAVFRNSESEFV